jgi:hypothetical protein
MVSSPFFDRFGEAGRFSPSSRGGASHGLGLICGLGFWPLLVPQLLVRLLQLLHSVQQLANHSPQRLNQRRPLLGPYLGKLRLHASRLPNSSLDSCASVQSY